MDYKFPKEGDVIRCRGTKTGIIVEIDALDLGEKNRKYIWARILWEDETMTWEDLECNFEDKIFEVISECR